PPRFARPEALPAPGPFLPHEALEPPPDDLAPPECVAAPPQARDLPPEAVAPPDECAPPERTVVPSPSPSPSPSPMTASSSSGRLMAVAQPAKATKREDVRTRPRERRDCM